MSVSEENPLTCRPDARAVAEQLRPVLERMEIFRKEILTKRSKSLFIALSIVGVAWVVALLIMASGGDETTMGLVVGVVGTIIAFVLYSLMAGQSKREYLNRFKDEVFRGAVKIAVPEMEYQPTSMIPQSSFERSGLFSSRIDRYDGEDCFKGKFGATHLTFSELTVERVDKSTDSKGHTTTHTVTVFKGIYLIADFNKDFACQVKIEPDVAEAAFGWVGRKLQGISGNLVRLESPEFEQAFKVTSNDAVGARYLLTPDMQERFLALRNDWSKDIHAVLMDSSLHLAIPQRENWFETSMDNPADDLPPLHGFLVQLMLILKITETLDLNTRLWTKE